MEVDTRDPFYSTLSAEALPNGLTVIIVGVIWNSLRFSIVDLLIVSIHHNFFEDVPYPCLDGPTSIRSEPWKR